MDMRMYRELATFAQFGTEDLDAATKAQLERGQRAVEILKQDQNKPLSLGEQVAVMYALSNGYLDDVAIDKIGEAEAALHSYLAASHPKVVADINETQSLEDELEERLNKALDEFKKTVPLS